MGGIAVAVLGIWIIVQVVGGDALGRLGLTDDDTDRFDSTPPNDGSGHGGGGSQ